jgi:hypothetical protein
MASSSVKMSKNLPEAFDKGVKKNGFNRKRMPMGTIPPSSPLGEAHMNPVGSPVTGPFKSEGIHEGFQKDDGMMIDLLPVLRKDFGHFPQEMRGQMGNFHPGQDKETGVLNNERNVSIPVGGSTPDKMVTAGHLPGGAPPTDASQRAILMKGHILEMFPHSLAVTQIMIGRNETFVERLPGGTSNLLDLDGANLLERSFEGTLVMKRNRDGSVMPWPTSRSFLPRRKIHIPCSLQTQKQLATSHDLGHSVALLPIPKTADLLRNEFPSLRSMPLDNGADEDDVTLCDPSTPDDKCCIHGSLYSITVLRTPAIF